MRMGRYALALAVVGMACAAQALTWDWTYQGGASGTLTGADGMPIVDGWDRESEGTTLTYAAKVTFAAAPSSGNVVIFQLSNSSTERAGGGNVAAAHNNGIRIALNSEGQLVFNISNTDGADWKPDANTDYGTHTTTGLNLLDGQEHVIAVVANNNNATTGTDAIGQGRYRLVVDGQELFTIPTESSGSLCNFWGVTLDTLYYGAEGITTDFDLFVTEGVVPSADLTVRNVPEPTALALLALGVAGLALRRRAA